MTLLDIDGSHGEGGGQLVRTAVALSAITGLPIRIRSIRARRSPPGLAPQHLSAVRAVGVLCRARIEGLLPRSQEIAFFPSQIAAGEHTFDVGTAGSISLVLQAALPVMVAVKARFRIRVIGGTDIRAAPPIDYLAQVMLPQLRGMGANVQLAIQQRGYYPRGGGIVDVEVEPGALKPLRLESPGRVTRIHGLAHVSHLPAHIAQRMTKSALSQLESTAPCDISVIEDETAMGAGGAVVLWAQCEHTVLGAGRVAQRGVPAETLGTDAGAELAADLAARVTLDIHAADQLLVYFALAAGESTYTTRTVSSHAQTAMWLVEQFVPCGFETVQKDSLTHVRISPRR